MLFRHNGICRYLIIALQALALVLLLASNSWASPDRSKVIVSDHSSFAIFFKTTNGSDIDEPDHLVSESTFLFKNTNYLPSNTLDLSRYQLSKSALYLARAPPLPSGF